MSEPIMTPERGSGLGEGWGGVWGVRVLVRTWKWEVWNCCNQQPDEKNTIMSKNNVIYLRTIVLFVFLIFHCYILQCCDLEFILMVINSHTHIHTHTSAGFALWPNIYSEHTPTYMHPWSLVVIPNPQILKVSGVFDTDPIDHHYYCSLLIPMEMSPAAVVLGDWGWGQSLQHPDSEYKNQLVCNMMMFI